MGVTASVSIVKTKHKPIKTNQNITYNYKAVLSRPQYELPTRENKDEESADAPDDADDSAHVGDVHGNEEGDRDPDHGESHPAAALKGLGDDAPAVPSEAHHQVQDDRPDPRTDTASTATSPTDPLSPAASSSPPQKKNYWINGDDGDAKQ